MSKIWRGGDNEQEFKNLLVGNCSHDDAAVMAINDHQAIISTTNFFTPIVEDALGQLVECQPNLVTVV
jgi:selenophosphate synthase